MSFSLSGSSFRAPVVLLKCSAQVRYTPLPAEMVHSALSGSVWGVPSTRRQTYSLCLLQETKPCCVSNLQLFCIVRLEKPYNKLSPCIGASWFVKPLSLQPLTVLGLRSIVYTTWSQMPEQVCSGYKEFVPTSGSIWESQNCGVSWWKWRHNLFLWVCFISVWIPLFPSLLVRSLLVPLHLCCLCFIIRNILTENLEIPCKVKTMIWLRS